MVSKIPSEIALPLTNLLLGLGNIGAGIGFGLEEKKKMDELDKKSKKLQDSAAGAGNLYDHIYYLVAVNLERVKKSFDKIPSDLLKKVQKQIVADISDSNLEKVIKVIATVVNYTDQVIGLASAIVDIVIAIRKRKASGQEPPEPPGEGPFENVPGSGEAPPTPSGGESSIPESPKLKRLSKGLQIGGIVFGAAGLAMTIGLGVWTLEKLDKAISDVEEKQKQVDAFQKAMTDVLDPIVKDAGLPAKSYKELIKMGEGWKKISENFDSYEKSFCFAISGFFMKKSLADIKSTVKKRSDQGKPFPEDGYALAETLAGDIKYQFDQKKTDKEVVAFFATENPKVGLRFVFNEYFISSLH